MKPEDAWARATWFVDFFLQNTNRATTWFKGILLQNANIDENNFCKHGGNIVKIVEQKYVFAMLLLATQCKHCMDVKKKSSASTSSILLNLRHFNSWLEVMLTTTWNNKNFVIDNPNWQGIDLQLLWMKRVSSDWLVFIEMLRDLFRSMFDSDVCTLMQIAYDHSEPKYVILLAVNFSRNKNVSLTS